jgi:Porin subfamily
MKIIRSLVLGTWVSLAAITMAGAADLPVKAKAVEYVKICSLYGAGYYYIPGTDTCIKLGGYLRMDVLANTNSDDLGPNSGAGGAGNRFTDSYLWRSREDISIDTRTATEYGVVRTFGELVFSWTNDAYAGTGAGGTVYALVPGTTSGGAPYNASSGASTFGAVGVYNAFMQFAGFTIGKAISQFSAPWTNYPGNNFDGLVGGGGTVVGVNQFSYTADFGSGVSGTISAQDPSVVGQAGVVNVGVGAGGVGTAALGAFGTSDYGNTVAPDFIGMVRVDQAWGLFQISVAAHDNNVAYYGANELTGHPDDKWGGAVALALSIKNLPTGPGDSINIQGVYTDGATRYNLQDLSSVGAWTSFGGASLPGAYQSIGFGMAPDTVFGNNGGSQQLIQTWGMRGAYNHNWNPYWSSSIYGAYAGIMYNSAAKTLICGNGVTGGSFQATYGAGVTSCNPNYSIGQVGLITIWTPVRGLAFSADLTYQHLDQNMAGTIAYPGSATIGKPAATYQLADQNTLSLLLRANRNF